MSKASGLWVHKKTGGFYTVLFNATNEADLVETVVYKALKDGSIWLRPHAVFYDGRFRRLTTDELDTITETTY